jgi:hypothetical protein
MSNASPAACNAALDGIATAGLMAYVSGHTGSPGTTGANEHPATSGYTRQGPCSWNTASGGSKTNSTALTFSTDGVTPVTSMGTNSASGTSGGTYGVGMALTASVTAPTITVAAGALTESAS